MLNLPLVSVVITSYNYSQFIEDCLYSILNQTYRPVECIIIDDCSTDNSVEIIQNFIEKNKNSDITFRLVQQEVNQGQLAGFVRGIKEASGIFINYVDADDIILPEFVNTHVQAHFETNVAMTVSQQIEFDQDNQVHSLYSLAVPQESTKELFSFERKSFNELGQLLNNQNFINNEIKSKVINAETHPFNVWHWGPTSCVMFRKTALELFVNADCLYENWKYCSDKLIFSYAHLLGGSCLLYIPLVAYRRHTRKNFSNFAIVGDKRFFTENSLKIKSENKAAVFPDILKIFINGKENFIQSMGEEGILNLVKLMFKNNKARVAEQNIELLKKVLNCPDNSKIFKKLNIT